MRGIEAKAVQLVINNNVTVDLYRLNTDGAIDTASGTVESGDETYRVSIDPDGGSCDCTFGDKQPGKLHSHSLALRLQAQQEAAKGTET